MKKVLLIFMALAIALTITACSNKEEENPAQLTNTTAVTTKPAVNVTAPAKSDSNKGEKLAAKIKELLGEEAGEVSGNIHEGSFIWQRNEADPEELYKNEASDEIKAQAEENAKAFVEGIKEFYSDELTFFSSEMRLIGGNSEEGVDSALYEITYLNSQNQTLVILTDSSAIITYVGCEFTW